jgi:hypothetical protein
VARPRHIMELKVHPRDLRARMAESGFNMRTLAARVGCSKSVIGRLVNGEQQRIAKSSAVAIESALSLESGEYFRDAVRVRKVSPASGCCRNCGTAA